MYQTTITSGNRYKIIAFGKVMVFIAIGWSNFISLIIAEQKKYPNLSPE
jgi:hypothetical protein